MARKMRTGSMVLFTEEELVVAELKEAIEEVLPTLRYVERQLYYIAKECENPADREDLWHLRDKVRQCIRRLEEAWENA